MCTKKSTKRALNRDQETLTLKRVFLNILFTFSELKDFTPVLKNLTKKDKELIDMEGIAFPKFAKYPLSYCQLRRTLK